MLGYFSDLRRATVYINRDLPARLLSPRGATRLSRNRGAKLPGIFRAR